MFTTRYAPFRRVHVTFNAFLTVSRPIAISSQQRKDPSIGGLKLVARSKAATAVWAELVHPAVVKDWPGAQQQGQALVWDGDLPSYQSYTRIASPFVSTESSSYEAQTCIPQEGLLASIGCSVGMSISRRSSTLCLSKRRTDRPYLAAIRGMSVCSVFRENAKLQSSSGGDAGEGVRPNN